MENFNWLISPFLFQTFIRRTTFVFFNNLPGSKCKKWNVRMTYLNCSRLFSMSAVYGESDASNFLENSLH